MNTLKRLILLAPTLGLMGCAASNAPERDLLGSYSARASIAEARGGSDRPLARLPSGAGDVLAVRRHEDGGGLTQEIVYSGSDAVAGENRITVSLGEPRARSDDGTSIAGRLTDAGLDESLHREFPGVAMTLADEPLRTRAGDMSIASGSKGSTNCIFGWLVSEPGRLSLTDALKTTGQSTLTLRIRLCRAVPPATLKEIVRDIAFATPLGGGDAVWVANPTASVGLDGHEENGSDPAELRPSRHAVSRPHSGRRPVRVATRRGHARSGVDARASRLEPRDGVPLPDDVAVAPQPARVSQSIGLGNTRASDLPFPTR